MIAAREISAMYSAVSSAVSSDEHMQQLVSHLPARNGLYVTPQDMDEQLRADFMAKSADVQLKKIQSAQISQATTSQIHQLEQALLKDLKGKKMTFTLRDKSFQPFDALWYKPQSGGLESVSLTTHQISGKIHDISLEQNLVVLTPGTLQRRINPNRKFFIVYIINPMTLEPAVSVR